MRKIWSEMARAGGRGESDRRRQQFREERDKAILALIKPEDRAAYDAILENYRDQQQSMEREMRANFERAVEETNKILTPEQQAKYKEMLSRHRPPDRGGDRGGPGGASYRGGPSGGKRQDENAGRPEGDGGATPKPTTAP